MRRLVEIVLRIEVSVDGAVDNVRVEPDTSKKKEKKEKAPSFSSEIAEVLAHYVSFHPQSRPGRAAKDKVRARLREGYSVEDLKLAVDGCHGSPFHCGENDEHRKYQSIELIFRNSDKVDQFLDLARDSSGACLTPNTQRSQRAAERFLERFSESEPVAVDPEKIPY